MLGLLVASFGRSGAGAALPPKHHRFECSTAGRNYGALIEERQPDFNYPIPAAATAGARSAHVRRSTIRPPWKVSTS